MTASTTLVEALAKAQAEMENAKNNRENSHFKSKYSDLAGIRDATIPHLSKHGIACTQTMEFREGLWVLVTALRMGGDVIESLYPLPQSEKIQQQGSAITYAKRYSLSAICGISADDDDDGNVAQEAPAKPSNRVIDQPEVNGEVRDGLDRWVGEARQFLSDNIHTVEDLDTWKNMPDNKRRINSMKRDFPDLFTRIGNVITNRRDTISNMENAA